MRSKVLFIKRLNIEISTPALLLHTKGASVPHITREVLEMITKEKFAFLIPLLTTHRMLQGIESNNGDIGKFAGIEDYPTFMAFQDPSVCIPQAPMEKHTVPLYTRMGKKLFDTKTYMKAVEIFQPDMYELLSDNSIDNTSSKKRVQKSIDRNKVLLEECLQLHQESSKLKEKSLVFAPIGGGYSLPEREAVLNTVLSNSENINGYILTGLHCDTTNLENLQYDCIKEVVEFITHKLPNDKLRLAPGCWNAVTVLDLIQSGWDLFDTSMPYMATERGAALTFSFQSTHEVTNCYEINLNHEKYKDRFEPILKNCTCLTCKKYTRAYINHLLNTKELLAAVLIMIHNLHHYMDFFRVIRTIKSLEDLIKLRQVISIQYEEHLSQLLNENNDKKAILKKIKRIV